MTMRRLVTAAVATSAVTCCTTAQAAAKHPPFPHEAAEAGRWSLVIAAIALLVALPLLLWLVGFLVYLVRLLGSTISVATKPGKLSVPFIGVIRGAIVGADGRLSTSKTVAVTWTYAVAGGLLSIIIARWLGHGHAYGDQVKHGLQSGYALLIGGPIGAAILAKGIVGNQVDGGVSKPVADSAQPSDLVTNDAGETDLGDLQYVLFNTVALVFFFGELLSKPQLGLPTIPDVLLGLTSVSAVGYVAKKAVVSAALGVVKVDPSTASAGQKVTLHVSGLVDARGKLPQPGAVTIMLGATTVRPQCVTTTGAGPIVIFDVPAGLASGPDDVSVTYDDQTATLKDGLTITAAEAPG